MKRCLTFGEVLYDVYPTHKKIGGAPLNFGAHFAKLGGESYLCSAVGCDTLADELISEVKALGVDTSLVGIKDGIPTAYCKVTYNGDEPVYTLPLGVSYDFITYGDDERVYDIIYFGTLAVRSSTSYETLRALLHRAGGGFRFFDINLRQHFYSEALIRELLGYSDAVKLNRDEYEYVNRVFGLSADTVEAFTRDLAEKFGISLVIVTLDKDGAAVYDSRTDTFITSPIKPGEFVSAVGAGDSFSACFMYNYLSGAPISSCMEKATALASLVVGVEAAVPEYDAKDFVNA